MNLLNKIHLVLRRNKKNSITFLVLLMFLNTFFETLGVGLIIPLFGSLVDPMFGNNYPKIFSIFNDLTNQFWPSSIVASDRTKLILVILFSFLVIFTLRTIFSVYFVWKKGQFKFNLSTNMGNKIFRGYLLQPYMFHLRRNSAHLIRNSTAEVDIFSGNIETLITFLNDILLVLGIFIFLLIYDFQSTAFIALTLGLLALFFIFFTKNKIKKLSLDRQLHNGKSLQYAKEGLEGVKEIKLLGRESEFLRKFMFSFKIMADIAWVRSVLQILPKQFLELLMLIILIGFIYFSLINDISMSVAFTTLALYAGASLRVLPGVNRLITNFQNVKFSLPAINILYEEFKRIEDNEINISSKKTNNDFKINFNNSLKLEKISFSYENTENKKILNNVNLEIKKGDFVGIMGISGVGKSTLMDIMLGVLSPNQGRVLVDEKDVSMNLRSWQDKLGYVPQNIFLSDDTIKKNIAFGIKEELIDKTSLDKAIKIAALDDLIKQLPNGVDTFVGERGTRLSGGQRQRIGIARAFYHNPTLLILDEALNAVDLETENKILDSIKQILGEKTVLIVSHRKSTLESCDSVYRVEKNKITYEKIQS